MAGVNQELLRMALEKQSQDPAVAGGGMGGGYMPPNVLMGPGAGDPSMGGAVPPGATAQAAAPPPGMAPAPMQPQQPGMAPGMPGQPQQPVQQKIKPEQWMQALDFRLYNIQQQLTAIMNHGGIQMPPEALILPPGMPAAPTPESALPGSGSPVDQATQQAAQQGQGQEGTMSPIGPMEASGAPPGGNAAKAAAAILLPLAGTPDVDPEPEIVKIGSPIKMGQGVPVLAPVVSPPAATPALSTKAAATAALLRSRFSHAR